MPVDQYWPSIAHIDECIRTEAEAVDEAVLLAVHNPGPLMVRYAGSQTEEPAGEQELFDALMRTADDGSAVLVAITGASGVGKSHMIRWLHAQLQRHVRRDHLVVVLIPKTASLRQVVEGILSPLEGATYERLKSELGNAVEGLSTRQATLLLAAALVAELEQGYSTGLAGLQQQHSQNAVDAATARRTRSRLSVMPHLIQLLREAKVLDLWLGTAIERILKHARDGGDDTETHVGRRFVPADFVPPDTLPQADLTQNGVRALQYISKNDGAVREDAASIMQEALDPALRTIFRFSEALGQKTIEELVDDIRRKLLEDGKELVLLIEDFAALAGIQQPLLSLVIAHSDEGGVRVRCPLRTALAVTDGFMPSRQGWLTRAKCEWIIPTSATDDTEVVRRLTTLAGRYLNAARWGATKLREQFDRGRAGDTDQWVEKFTEDLTAEDEETLADFGDTGEPDRYPLFPLSPTYIEALCHKELRDGSGRIRFNPRDFINRVLRDTLQQRALYANGEFPPAGFKHAVPQGDVTLALETNATLRDKRERLAPVLTYWAGNPGSLSEQPTVGRGLFTAFTLPWPFQPGRVRLPVTPRTQPSRVSPLPPRNNAGASAHATHNPDVAYLRKWEEGSPLGQDDAKRVRRLVATALDDRIDWTAQRMGKRKVDPERVWLPNVRVGNPTTEPRFVLAHKTTPILIAGLRALERWSANTKSWDFDGAEEAYDKAQYLLDQIEGQVVAWHESIAALKQAAVTLRSLHRQALLLRLTDAPEPASPELERYYIPPALRAPALLGDGPEAYISGAVLTAESTRPFLQEALADAVGCFQGHTGRRVLAIDSRRLRLAWRTAVGENDHSYIPVSQEKARVAATEMLTRVKTLVIRYKSAVMPVVGKVQEVSPPTDGLEAVASLIRDAQSAGVFPQGRQSADALGAVERLAAPETEAILAAALSFSAPPDGASIERQLATWSQLDIWQLVTIHAALVQLDQVVAGIDRAVRTELQALGTGNVTGLVETLRLDLGRASTEGQA